MQDDYRILVKEHLICGVQIHVGVANRDLAVRLSQRLRSVTPALLAPGLISLLARRSPATPACGPWPGNGGRPPGLPRSNRLTTTTACWSSIATGVITDTKMSYWDVRPGHDYPTVELRVCDACPLVDDALLIAGLFRAAVEEAERDASRDATARTAGPLHWRR